MDVPTSGDIFLYGGLSSVDFAVADLTATIIPQAYNVVIRDCTVLVRNEVLTQRQGDTTDTKFVLAHKYIADSEYSSFDVTTDVSDVVVFDSEDPADVSGTTLTVSSIDALQGFVTLSGAATGTLYGSYRWCPVAVVGGSTDQLLKLAVIYKTCEMCWDAILGPMDQVNVQSYQVTQRNHFREFYNRTVDKIRSLGEVEAGESSFIVKERKTHIETIKSMENR